MILGTENCFEFYGISEQPFGGSGDPRYFYISPELCQTLTALLHNIESGHQLQVLSADPGLGKTTLLRTILTRLEDRVDSAYIFHFGGAAELLGFTVRAFGLSDPDPSLIARRETLNRFLAERDSANKPILLVIDEAQGLDQNAFEELDRLLASGTGSLQVILSGQTQLLDALNNTAPGTLRAQATAFHHLCPLQTEHTSNYVQYRLEVAGYTGPDLFTREALELIAEESSGIPRNINTLCFHALLYGAKIKSARIDRDVITHILPNCAFRALGLNELQETPSSTFAVAVRDWLVENGGVWSGTIWELHQQLRSAKPVEFEQLAIASHTELAEKIAKSSIPLHGAGIEVNIRRLGKPPHVVLRLIENSSGY